MRCSHHLLALALAAGCTGGQRVPDAPDAAEAVPGVPLAALIEAGRAGDLAAVLPRLDAPRRIETEPVENRHVPGQIDTLRTYLYDGLQLQFYDVSGSAKLLATHLRVTGDGYAAPSGLRVGLPPDSVRRMIGPADRRTGDGAFVYEQGDVTPTLLYVYFSEDAVSKLEWSFYVD